VRVVATAGHVDHGKSTLVDALTGMRSDRLAEERRRGLSIELGYTWTRLKAADRTDGEPVDVAFVDVPGHERFVTTMLAGIGPVPAAMLVVAADDPWMPQAAEHLAALDALGVEHGVVAVTRSDLADPAPMVARAADEVGRTSLAGSPVVAVSARSGHGVPALRDALVTMVARLPAPDPAADVRLWVDRRFSVTGAGTVVTGTLPAGTVAKGDQLSWESPRGPVGVRVRGVQSLGQPVAGASGVARVALNLVGEGLEELDRGAVLVTPGAYRTTTEVDVRVLGEAGALPAEPVLHVGAASSVVRTRPLDGDVVRLRLPVPLPLRVGDRALLRDPGARRVWGVRVLDPVAPALRRRGAARRRADALAAGGGLAAEVTRRGVVDRDTLAAIGVPLPGPAEPLPDGVLAVGRWLAPTRLAALVHERAARAVATHDEAQPLDPGVPLRALAERLRLPDEVVAACLRPPLRVEGGRVRGAATALPADLEAAVAAVARDLEGAAYDAPHADRLAQLGLDDRRQAAAAKAGRLLRVAPGIVLLPGADRAAAAVLADLPQPFTTSQARQALATSRRVVLPLLDHLDRAGLTRRLPDDRREVRPR